MTECDICKAPLEGRKTVDVKDAIGVAYTLHSSCWLAIQRVTGIMARRHINNGGRVHGVPRKA